MLPLLSRIEPLESRIAPAAVASINVTSLDGTNGLRVDGTGTQHYAGTSVSGAGDINGDGFDDFIFGESVPPGQNREGRAFVVFGKASGFPAALDPLTLNGSDGFEISGAISMNPVLGPGVARAGDVNEDGFDDVLVSGGSGAAVIFGKASGFAPNLSLDTLNGSNGFNFYDPNGSFEESAASAGDVNGDGFDDLIFRASPDAYVVFGKASGFAPFLDVTTVNGSNGFVIDVASDTLIRPDVSGLGDMNGDGFDDVVVGSMSESQSGAPSDVYVIFGHGGPFAASFPTASLNGANGFRLQGDQEAPIGYSVAGAGDLNADGFEDLITNRAVVFGRATFPALIVASSLDGTQGFRLGPTFPFERGVASAGDFNHDGFDDFLIGQTGTPSVSLIFGKATPFAAEEDFSSLDGTNGLTIVMPQAGRAGRGYPLASAGDVNGDGVGDVIVGSPDADYRGIDSGAAYVVFGLAPSLTINDASVAEGLDGVTTATFTVSLSGTLDRAVSVSVATGNGTGLAGEDYDALAATELTFAPGETAKTVQVTVRGDAKFEPNETFTLNLSNATAATISDAQGVGTITNDDARPVITISDLALPEPAEGDTFATLTVSLSNPSSEPITVNYGTEDGTAVAQGDYGSDTSKVSFAPGELTKEASVRVHADAIFEADETFKVILSGAPNATIGDATGQITILNVQPAPTISVADVEVIEGDAFNVAMDFTVTLSGPSSSPVTMTYMLQAGSAHAPADYVDLEPTVLTFAPGETTKGIRVETVGNTHDDEDTRTFFFQLAEPSGATFADPTANGVIVDNDAPPSFSITSTAVPEGNTAETFATFTVSLSAPSGRATSVEYATAAGTAGSGADFTARAGVLDFTPGETSKSLTVPIAPDAINEADETFLVNLSAPVNATLATAQGTGTILDNDPLPTITIDDVRVAEGPTGGFPQALFTVSLSAPSGRDIRVEFATQDGTALAGSDYIGRSSGFLVIPAGALQGVIDVGIIGDREVEPAEQFFVTLSSPSGGIVGDGIATGTIANDDVVLVTPHLATFTDEDGDLVSVRLTHGKLTADDFTLSLGSGTIGMRFAEISLVGRGGGDLVIKATPQLGFGGNGEVNVGRIDACGTALARVKVRGDLGEIDAGRSLFPVPVGTAGSELWEASPQDSDVTIVIIGERSVPAIGLLDVRSMGLQRAIGSTTALESTLFGGAGTVLVRGDVSGIRLIAAGPGAGFPSVTIGGDVDGDGAVRAGILSDGGIGAVFVAGDWRGSSLAAGAGSGLDGFFGTGDDTLLPGGDSAVAAIARITIKGGVFGTEAPGDHFGFVAEKLGKLKIAGAVVPLNRGPRNDLDGIPLGTTGDFRAREVTA